MRWCNAQSRRMKKLPLALFKNGPEGFIAIVAIPMLKHVD
jgi:hypothetical protein